MPKVFTLLVEYRRYLHSWNAEGIYTVLSEGIYTPCGIQGVFTLDDKGYLHRKVNAEGIYTGCEMPRVFTLDSTGVFTP